MPGNCLASAYQKLFLRNPDGLGYYSYSSSDRQYGTKGTIQALQDVAMQFHHNAPAYELGIGDISFAKGGHMKPHDSHQRGLNMDIRPVRTDKAHLPVRGTRGTTITCTSP